MGPETPWLGMEGDPKGQKRQQKEGPEDPVSGYRGMEEKVLMKMDLMGNRGGGKKAHQQGRGCGQSLHRGQCQMSVYKGKGKVCAHRRGHRGHLGVHRGWGSEHMARDKKTLSADVLV